MALVSGYLFAASRRPVRAAGVVAASWSVAGVFLIAYGLPGIILFPGLLTILLAGSILDLKVNASRMAKVRIAAIAGLMVIVTIGLVIL